MVRVNHGAATRRKKNRYFKQAKGFRAGRHNQWRMVRETLLRAWYFAFRDRRQRKRHFRRLWILRINAAARMRGLSYSQLIDGLKKAKVDLNRKNLSHLALNEPKVFDELVGLAKGARS
ncbi:MAG: 50S ribosomal protein L20 [Planctomycetota bacterium]|nr:MAG: 50S ribosomal protein L20 [Planctomycetota bacterium]